MARAPFIMRVGFHIFITISNNFMGKFKLRPEGIPSTFAMSLAIAAIYFSLKYNFRASFLLASVTVLFHFLIGIYVALIIAVYIFLCSKYKQNILYIFIFLCSSLTIFFPTILLSQSSNTEDLNFIEVYVHLERHIIGFQAQLQYLYGL